MAVTETVTQPALSPPARPLANRLQGALSAAWLVVLVLMCTQYAVCRFGQAWVLIAPIGYHGNADIRESKAEQPPGLYIINWQVLDEAHWKLDKGLFLPPAEGLLALLFLGGLLLWPLTGRGWAVWPRFAAWSLVGLGGLSLLAAAHFSAGLRELAQMVLTILGAWWVAGLAVGSDAQFKRFAGWLGVLTVVLVLLGLFDYWRFVLRPETPLSLAVRATCASRTVYSGLLVILLSLAGARVIATGRPVAMLGWAAVCVVGLIPILNAGALLALVVAWTAIASSRGLFGFLLGLVLSLALLFGVSRVSPLQQTLLRESIGFYRTGPGGPVAIEKRYLEMAASLGGLRETQGVTGQEPDEHGSLPLLGEQSNVLFGVGPGQNYQRAIGAFYGNLDNPEKQEPDSYNLYLMLAVQLGLFGAFIWAWLLFDSAAVARVGATRLTDPDQRAFLLGLYGASLGLVVFSVYGTILVRGLGLLWFSLLGVASRLLWQPRPPRPARAPRRAEPVAPVTPEAGVAAVEPPADAVIDAEGEQTGAAAPSDTERPAADADAVSLTGEGGGPEAAELDWSGLDGPSTAATTPEDRAAAAEDLQAWLDSEGIGNDEPDDAPGDDT